MLCSVAVIFMVSRLNIEFSKDDNILKHIVIANITDNELELHRPANPPADELLQQRNSQLCEVTETLEMPSNVCQETIKLHRIKSV
jgi:hypothetical protein